MKAAGPYSVQDTTPAIRRLFPICRKVDSSPRLLVSSTKHGEFTSPEWHRDTTGFLLRLSGFLLFSFPFVPA